MRTNTLRNKYTRRRFRRGGEVLDSGGYGCVFYPSLKCKGVTLKRKKYISKLQLKKDGKLEFDIIVKIKNALEPIIPNYYDYFLLDVYLCPLTSITKRDLKGFRKKCVNKNITLKKIISHPSQFNILTIKNGGKELYDYIQANMDEVQEIYAKLVELRDNAIIPMFKKARIVHSDLKQNNILVQRDENGILRVRIIDWGFAYFYPENNFYLQFNTPFSTILFMTEFTSIYKHSGDYDTTFAFVLQYLRGIDRSINILNDMISIVFEEHMMREQMNKLNENIDPQQLHYDYKTMFMEKYTLPMVATYLTEILIKYGNNMKAYQLIYYGNVDLWSYYMLICEVFYNIYDCRKIILELFRYSYMPIDNKAMDAVIRKSFRFM